MEEAHNSRYSIHPGSTEMYRDLREVYWLNGMKKGIVEFVAKCPNCQQARVENQRPSGMAQKVELPEWNLQMAPYEALYGKRCRYPIRWFEVGEAGLIGPYLVHQAMEKVKVIQEGLKTT
ncbi:hypothetical protein MTR67_031293 [Solanum verrucosum]|uniref:Integrase zinc-binding domain-containing protein n=1 Tax=Solanum verrucosum TaxID=315347 RepID=A0AAF0ZFX9_SOLVR|nr:hypothetical protein MTR67_031293 [Solanum verrucosum]